jgi:biopolymer transport protein TolQ
MNAFVNINQISGGSEVSLAVVSGPIAEALVATAIGLFAAIPAVIAYNYFVSRIRVLSAEMDNFSADFLNIVKRHFLK